MRDEKCFNCGRAAPGLWGFAPAINRIAKDVSFGELVLFGCVILFVISLALRPSAIQESRGFFGLLSPGTGEVWLLGASGAIPIFRDGRWWTVLSAAWLHGSLLHIAFNMYWIRSLASQIIEILGLGRTVIVYTAGAAFGFLGTSIMYLLPLPGGAPLTLGASASLCGLVGGLYAYGRRSGSSVIRDYVMRFAISMAVIGFLMRGVIDNWAHLFGFLGGFVVAQALKPLEDEGPLHLVGAFLCLLAFAAAIALSVLDGLPLYRAS
ncbi:MAG: rhomboid family intramembrane serine protease [Acidobacteriota bacterium]